MVHTKKIDPGSLSEKILSLRKKLADYKPKITAAYLFGSVAKGLTRPLSDIDFAVLYNSEDQKTDASVFKIVTGVFGTDKIDYINLKDAPLRLRYEIVKDGIKIVVGNEKRLLDFETQTIMNYLDFKPIQQEFYEEYIKNI